jgi:hypothetical protein
MIESLERCGRTGPYSHYLGGAYVEWINKLPGGRYLHESASLVTRGCGVPTGQM